MTEQSTVITQPSFTPKQQAFFDSYRQTGLKAVQEAATAEEDTILAIATHHQRYIAGAWTSEKFGKRDALGAVFRLVAAFFAVALIGAAIAGCYMATTMIGFETLARGAVTSAALVVLGLLVIGGIATAAAAVIGLPCQLCLATSLWIRGWTSVSMEWFGAYATAVWALGDKKLYIWQKPWHGWGAPTLRPINYQNITRIHLPSDNRNLIALLFDGSPGNESEFLAAPIVHSEMTAGQFAEEILRRAEIGGRSVETYSPPAAAPTESNEDTFVLYPPIRPPESCWKPMF